MMSGPSHYIGYKLRTKCVVKNIGRQIKTKRGFFHFTSQPLEGNPGVLSSPLGTIFKKIENQGFTCVLVEGIRRGQHVGFGVMEAAERVQLL